MNLFELYNRISLQDEIIAKINGVAGEVSFEAINQYLNQLMDIKTAHNAYIGLKKQLGKDEDNIKLLLCNLECARRVYIKYQDKKISDPIFFDTMKCFTRFIQECQQKTGRLFFDRGWWTYRQISMSLFRIGQLEYELNTYNNKKAISIHIPSDVDFRENCVDQSLNEANCFFKKYYPEYSDCEYICNSWLLSPVLKNLLHQDSNIMKFQDRFEMVSTDLGDKEYIEWLFQVPKQANWNELKEETSLQRNVKKLVLQGNHIGSGFGVLK